MTLFAFLAAFGGGVLGGSLGALPSFIITGVFAAIGMVITMCGGDGSAVVNGVAFGPFLSPAVAFLGGVAAAAYAGKKGLQGGADIATAPNGHGKADVIVVGGVFGVIGWLIQNLAGFLPAAIATDAPGFAVFFGGIIVRLAFGKTGVIGKYDGAGKREFIGTGAAMAQNVVLGLGYGALVSFIAAMNADNAAFLAGFPVMCFGYSAISLIFAQTGFAIPTTHHITLPAAFFAVTGIGMWGPMGAILGVVMGIVASIIGDFAGRTFNSYCDSHIDPPAFTILLLTSVNSLLNTVL